jgi:4'-phosphopantetheinyl transferase
MPDSQFVNLLLLFRSDINYTTEMMVICCYTDTMYEWPVQELVDKLILLPEKLQEQALRKKNWIDKQLSILGKVLLLKVLQERNNEYVLDDLKYSEYQRPYFESGIDFNISHSGHIVACCDTDKGQIGIDIELVKEIDLSDFTDHFTANEWEHINKYPNKYEGFYDFWTRKEAVIKAIGTGFSTPLSSLDVSGEKLVYNGITYHITPVTIDPAYRCHIATTVAHEDIVLKQSPLSSQLQK